MEDKKGDPRMYVISGFLLLCVVSGGIILGLYMFLPEKYSSPYYAAAGLILVGVPWIFWFLAYVYKCFSPSSNDEKRIPEGNLKRVDIAASPATSPKQSASPTRAKPTSPTEESRGEDPKRSPRVHFGEVIVLGNEERENVENGETAVRDRHWRMISESIEDSDCNLLSDHDNKDSVDQRGIEMPLPLL